MLGGLVAAYLVARELPFLSLSDTFVFRDAGVVLIAGAITCAGGYLCPLRSRCDEATRSCDCEAGFVAVDCSGTRCTSCPGVSYRCIPL